MIEELIRMILSSNTAIRISMTALIISVISLYLGFRNQQSTRNLEALEKRTAYLLKMLQVIEKGEEALGKIKEIHKICKDCFKSDVIEISRDLEETINTMKDSYDKFEKLQILDPLKWETIFPLVNKSFIKAESLVVQANDLYNECKNCDEKL